jgi:hypothetical protein
MKPSKIGRRLILCLAFASFIPGANAQSNVNGPVNSPASTPAATNPDELSQAIRDYLKLTNAENQHPIVIGFMTETVVRAARSSLGESLKAKPMQANKQQDANQVMGKNFGEFADSARKSLIAKFPWSRMVEDVYIPAYKKQFSLAEMKSANEFYRSAVGRKVVEISPQIIADATKTMGEKYSPQLSRDFSGQVDQLVKKIRTELDKLEK